MLDSNQNIDTPAQIATNMGERLKALRLNSNITQAQLAKQIGISRKAIIQAETGHTTLVNLIAIMQALGQVEQLYQMLPEAKTSPMQLLKLKQQKRRRASGTQKNKQNTIQVSQW